MSSFFLAQEAASHLHLTRGESGEGQIRVSSPSWPLCCVAVWLAIASIREQVCDVMVVVVAVCDEDIVCDRGFFRECERRLWSMSARSRHDFSIQEPLETRLNFASPPATCKEDGAGANGKRIRRR